MMREARVASRWLTASLTFQELAAGVIELTQRGRKMRLLQPRR